MVQELLDLVVVAEATVGKKSYAEYINDIARNVVESNGFSGGMCYSFESKKVFDKLLLPADAPERSTLAREIPINVYKIPHTIGNKNPGGDRGGFSRALNVSIEFFVRSAERPPTASVEAIVTI